MVGDRLGLMATSQTPSGDLRATGPFEVTMHPQPPYDNLDGVSLGRITINKRFHGDLDGTSVVEMLSAMTNVKGSAGYVAIERVVGTLKGRVGSFVLQHSGTMNRGEANLTVSIVPDSGTGELRSIAGTLKIDVVDGKHAYTLDYSLVDSTPE
jgi:hypothetical protein